MLEDDFRWVLKKALVRAGLAPSEAAARAGLAETEVMEFIRGNFTEQTARKLATVLDLREEPFATHANYTPRAVLIPGIHRLDLSFGEDQVNAWLVEKENEVLLFDLGNEPDEVFDELAKRGKRPTQIFVTHGHGDHMGAIARAKKSGIPLVTHENVSSGDEFSYPALRVKVVDLDGHFIPARGFLVEGFKTPVIVVGDAIFAGSIGGCPNPDRYHLALKNIRAILEKLPDETLILPGHGPATTLGEERNRNPFPLA